MITYQEALEIALTQAEPKQTVELPLADIGGAYLAQPVIAPFDSPRFNNSAADGYGVIAEDLVQATDETPVNLPIVQTIRAGQKAEVILVSGNTIKLFTGAPVPTGVNAVVKKEIVEVMLNSATFKLSVSKGENIRFRGEEYHKGAEVLPLGTHITPAVIGLLASLGFAFFPVHKKPTVALLVTGDELVKPGKPLQSGQIYDSNSYALKAALKTTGIVPESIEIVGDSLPATKTSLQSALKNSDVIISVGGVSVGDYDYIEKACQELNVTTQYHGISMKPGKPNYFGTFIDQKQKKKLIFGLPGNPVAAMISFHLLVKPVLKLMMGAKSPKAKTLIAELGAALTKQGNRLEFVRGILQTHEDRLTVFPIESRGSHMIQGLAAADCLIHIDPDQPAPVKGSQVTIELLDWFK